MNRKEEFDQKIDQVRRLMTEKNWGGVALGTLTNFSWITCGGEAHVPIASEGAVARVIITPERACVLTNRIERGRLADEEVADLGIEVLEDEWYEPSRSLRTLIPGGRIASDQGLPDTDDVSAAMAGLRLVLLPPEIDRYREVGRLAEEGLRAAAKAVRKGDSEYTLAGRLTREVFERGLTPTVCLIAADERIRRYRHPIPKDAAVEKSAMLVLCARKYGLIVSCTRLVHIGPLDADLKRRHASCVRVDAAFNLGTRPGRTYGDVFNDAAAVYEAERFPGEWKLHHQGGPTGYAGREFKASPDCRVPVAVHHVCAWNPSITGTKSEDTVLITDGAPEVLSAARDWPMLEAEHRGQTIARPDILVL